MIERCLHIIRNGGDIDFSLAMKLAGNTDLEELCRSAGALCRELQGDSFDLCSIINARSGKCSEDCKYCAQSVHHSTDIIRYEQIELETALEQALENDGHGVKRLSLVTAGRALTPTQMQSMEPIYAAMSRETSLLFCASMGFLSKETASLLYGYGVRRYHCNLESCESFFPSICTTHTWQEKVATLNIAKDVGMDLCSGGIIGMGETLEQRLQLAFELRELGVLSIPINILSPIAGTPLAHREAISLEDVLRCVALFRFINPRAVIRIAGGRGRFGREQYRLFDAGANGAIVGDYLTTAGAGVVEDLVEIKNRGFRLSRSTPHPK
jgi:biotin synthase